MVIKLPKRIDSSNATETEMKINEQIGDFKGEIIIDAADTEYISSAGLRVILRLKKANNDTKVVNCSSEVYEVFDMTGFIEMMEIHKAYRKISVEGCEIIGEGSNGVVYRTDPDTIVKVYKMPESLDEIKNERELARKAFVMGIPTAIPYDVVQVGDLFGSVFELLNAKSFSKLINEGEDIESLAKQSVDILKTIHSTEINDNSLPSQKEKAVSWAEYVVPYLPEEIGEKLLLLFSEVPERNTIIHGDYHIKNIMRQNEENLLIDMDTLSVGHPIFEFGQMYLAYQGFSEVDRNCCKRFLGIDYDTSTKFWRCSLKNYFIGKDDGFMSEIDLKSKLIAHTRLLRRTLKREPERTDIIESSKNIICEIVPKLENLYF